MITLALETFLGLTRKTPADRTLVAAGRPAACLRPETPLRRHDVRLADEGSTLELRVWATDRAAARGCLRELLADRRLRRRAAARAAGVSLAA